MLCQLESDNVCCSANALCVKVVCILSIIFIMFVVIHWMVVLMFMRASIVNWKIFKIAVLQQLKLYYINRVLLLLVTR